MKINYSNKTIEINKSEAQKAGNPDSIEFAKLAQMLKIVPGFEIVVKSSSNKKARSYSGLNYEYMYSYIEKHDDSENTIKREFFALLGMNENGERDPMLQEFSFGEVKMWFLDKFPEIEEYSKSAQKTISDIKAKRAEIRKTTAAAQRRIFEVIKQSA
ncbi:MAG: hypothetical protein IKY44_01635 [Clostridia bacterium]|nr:hypothetical protein [Clostridia bacterium]